MHWVKSLFFIFLTCLIGTTGCESFHDEDTFTYCDQSLKYDAVAVEGISSFSITDAQGNPLPLPTLVQVSNSFQLNDPEIFRVYFDCFNDETPKDCVGGVVNDSAIAWQDPDGQTVRLLVNHQKALDYLYYSECCGESQVFIEDPNSFSGGTLISANLEEDEGSQQVRVQVTYRSNLSNLRRVSFILAKSSHAVPVTFGPGFTCDVECGGSSAGLVDCIDGTCEYSCDNGMKGEFDTSTCGDFEIRKSDLYIHVTDNGTCPISSIQEPSLPNFSYVP